jgi:hypothetical protein
MPPELANVTWVEQRLAALCSASVLIKTLRGGGGGGQRALNSHVTTMITKPELVINKLLPLSPEDLAAEFRAIFVGKLGPTDPRRLAEMKSWVFRPQVVLALAQWRIHHNPLYRDVAISEERATRLLAMPDEQHQMEFLSSLWTNTTGDEQQGPQQQ